jgi:hypothetical protein
MSKKLLSLSSDLASFNNADPTAVLEALRSGLVGEAEPLRKFGINITAARIQAEAYALGLVKPVKDQSKIRAAHLAVQKSIVALAQAQKKYGKDSLAARDATSKVDAASAHLKAALAGQTGELTNAQKAQAAYSLIMKDSTLAHGDFARTSGGLANQQRILAANFVDAKAKLGTSLLPAMTHFVTFLNTSALPALTNIAGFIGDHGDFFKHAVLAAGVVWGLNKAIAGIKAAQAVVAAFQGAFAARMAVGTAAIEAQGVAATVTAGSISRLLTINAAGVGALSGLSFLAAGSIPDTVDPKGKLNSDEALKRMMKGLLSGKWTINSKEGQQLLSQLTPANRKKLLDALGLGGTFGGEAHPVRGGTGPDGKKILASIVETATKKTSKKGDSTLAQLMKQYGISAADAFGSGIKAGGKKAKSAAEKVLDSLVKTLRAKQASYAKLLEGIRSRIAGLRDSAKELASSISGPLLDSAQLINTPNQTVGGISDFLQGQLNKDRTFQRDLARLSKLNLSTDLISQLAQLGPDSGGNIVANLSHASTADLRRINSLQAQIEAVAKATGASVAQRIYSPQLDVLNKKVTRLEDAIHKVGADVAVALNKSAAIAKTKKRTS